MEKSSNALVCFVLGGLLGLFGGGVLGLPAAMFFLFANRQMDVAELVVLSAMIGCVAGGGVVGAVFKPPSKSEER